MQLKDNTKARMLDSEHNHVQKMAGEGQQFRAQTDIYNYLRT
jgi:hypothetical protein